MHGRVGRDVNRLEFFAHPAPAALASGRASLRTAGPAPAGRASPGSAGGTGARAAHGARTARRSTATGAWAAVRRPRGSLSRGPAGRPGGSALGAGRARSGGTARRWGRRQPARRGRRRDGLARTGDGRGSGSHRSSRRGARGRPLTRRTRWSLLLRRRVGVVADDALGGSDAAAGGDRHLGFGGPLGGRRFSGRGLGRLRLGGDGCRSSLGLGRHHRGLRLCGWDGDRLYRRRGHRSRRGLGRHRSRRGLGRRRGRGGLGRRRRGRRSRLGLGLRGLRLLDLDHRWGRRLQQPVAFGPPPDPVGLGLDNARGVGLDPDAERETEFERLLVAQPELFGELMDADLAWQKVPPSGLSAVCGPGIVPGTRRPRTPKPIYLARPNVSP